MKKPSATNRAITVVDVARKANVSKATAARVLGGYGVVSDKVHAEVLEAAKALDYRPNELARSMTTGKSGLLGVVVGDIENPFFSLAVRGISDVARAAGFNVILANSGEELEAEKAAVRVLIGKRVDGLIITPADSGEIAHLRDVERSGRPLALLDRALADFNVDTVTVDDREAAMGAARLLVAAGHRRIAYITAAEGGSTPGWNYTQIATSTVRERIAGLLAVCTKAGITAPERHLVFGAKKFRAAAIVAELFAGPDRPTAIIASDSIIGLEIYKALRDLSLNVPRDVSLITFHDADWTSVTTPPITVVDQPVYTMGKAVAELLIRQLKGELHPPQRIIVPTSIIERGSVGPVPIAAAQ
jgi:LacI family transcriptional regulator